MSNRIARLMNRITAVLLVLSLIAPCVPELPLAGWPNSTAHAEGTTAAQAPTHAFSLPEEVLGAEISSGEWRYALREGDGYAVVTAYSGSAAHPVLPATLGGTDVVGVASGAFGADVNAVTLHGNVLCIAVDAFAAGTVVYALNGSYALYHAESNNLPWVNTSAGVFTQDVVDFSDAPLNRVRRMGDTYVQLGLLEAQRVSVGSLFWMEDARGTVFFYRVTALTDRGDSVLATVEVPDVGDAVQELSLTQEVPLTSADFVPAQDVVPAGGLTSTARGTTEFTDFIDEEPWDFSAKLKNYLLLDQDGVIDDGALTAKMAVKGTLNYTVTVQNGELVSVWVVENTVSDIEFKFAVTHGESDEKAFLDPEKNEGHGIHIGTFAVPTGFLCLKANVEFGFEITGEVAAYFTQVTSVTKQYDFSNDDWIVRDEFAEERLNETATWMTVNAEVKFFVAIKAELCVFTLVKVVKVTLEAGLKFTMEGPKYSACFVISCRPFATLSASIGVGVGTDGYELGVYHPVIDAIPILIPDNLVLFSFHVSPLEPTFHAAGDCPHGDAATVSFVTRTTDQIDPMGVTKDTPIGNFARPAPDGDDRMGDFIGWATSVYHTVSDFNFGYFDGTAVSQDMTLYAIWENMIPVTFNTQCELSMPDVPAPVFGLVSEPPAPKRNGHSFLGWYTSPDGNGIPWNFASDTVSDAPLTLYAKWRNDITGDTTGDDLTSYPFCIGDNSYRTNCWQNTREYFEYSIEKLDGKNFGVILNGLSDDATHVTIPPVLTIDLIEEYSKGTPLELLQELSPLFDPLLTVEAPQTLPVLGFDESMFKGNTNLIALAFDFVGRDYNTRGMFQGCSNLEYVDMRNIAIDGVYNSMFAGCVSLQAVILPQTVGSINQYAFSGCRSLKYLTLPACVKALDYYAFNGCTGLTEIYIPDTMVHLNVTKSGSDYYGPFSYCTNVKRISVGGVEALTCGMIETDSTVLEEITIRGTVREIGENCFSDMVSDLKSDARSVRVVIEEGVEAIGKSAFSGCRSIVSLALPSTITRIDENAFNSCTRLSKMTGFENTQISWIGQGTFYSCNVLPNVTIPDTVTRIDAKAFWNCYAFTEVYIPDSVESLGIYMITTHQYGGPFYYCNNIRSISVGGVDTLSYAMIETGSAVLEKIAIRGSVNKIDDQCFSYRCDDLQDANLSVSFSIGEGVEVIGESAFSGCRSIVSLALPSTITRIDENAFNSCTRLSKMTGFENTQISWIGRGTFQSCNVLPNVTIPDTVTRIDAKAFWNCYAFTEVYIPDSVESLGIYMITTHQYGGPFYYCSNVRSISVGGVDTLSYAMIETGSAVLEKIAIRGSVNKIDDQCFSYRCDDLQDANLSVSVSIGEGVEVIGESAFSGCRSIVSLALPSTITRIDENAFNSCTRLSKLTGFENTQISWIGQGTFYSCNVLPNVTIPDTVTRIDAKAFWSCYAFTEVYIPDSVESLAISMITTHQYGGPFYYCSNIRSISVGGVDTLTYAMIETKSQALEEITIRGTVKSIGEGCFNNKVSDLKSSSYSVHVQIEEGVQTVGNSAFASCWSIVHLSLPSTLTSIGSSAFSTSSRLTTVTIPAGTSGFASNAFSKNPARTVYLTGANDEAMAYFTGLGDKVVTGDLPTFSITLNTAGGTFADGTETTSVACKWLSSVPALPVPVNGDKLFCGWYLDAACTKAFAADTMPATDLTLYAGWDINVYTVTLDLMGGILDHPLTFKAQAGSRPAEALVPALADRSFTGWYTDRYATVPFGGTMPATDLTLYAGYIKSGLNGEYTFSGGEATLVSYRLVEHESTTLYLPESVDGMPLTGIAANAFRGSGIEVLYLPASLTHIDPQALNGMNSLRRIEVRPGNTTFTSRDGILYSVDGSVLLRCPVQHGTVIFNPADGLTGIGDYAFAGVPLAAVTLPEGLLHIGSSAFSDSALTTVTLPDSLTHLGDYAFSGCDELLKVVFGSRLEEIGAGCFSGCSALMSTFGPMYGADGESPSVPSAYAEANTLRYNLYALTLQAASDTVWQVRSGDIPELPTSPNVGENAWFGGWWATKDFTGDPVDSSFRMPQGNTTLYARPMPVFTYETVTAEDSSQTLTLTSYDPLCGNLSPVVPEAIGGVPVTAIAAGCFPAEVMCITVPNCVTDLADGWVNEGFVGTIAAAADSAAAQWAESHNVETSAPQYTLRFNACGGASLTSVTAVPGTPVPLPAPVRTGYAFTRWYEDASLTAEAVLDENGLYAMPAADTVLYAGWTLTDEAAATLSFTWEEIGGAIRVTGLADGCTALVIPDTLHGLPVTSIADRAFAYEAALTSAVIPGSIATVPSSTFTGCSALTSVTLGEGVQTLADGCFSSCGALTELTLPATLCTIGSSALQGTVLTALHLPASLITIASDALKGCGSLASITVDEGNAYYTSIDSVLYDTADSKLIRYPAGRDGSEYTVDNIACVIGSYAFEGAALTSITLPESVISLDAAAFAGCAQLTALPSFPSPLLTRIPDLAFAGCYSLTEVVIPETVTTIGSSVFPAGVTIHGTTGTAAEAYAHANGLLFIDPNVTVLPEAVALSSNTLLLQRGETTALTAVITPENTTLTALRWHSDDPAVMSVSADGRLRALASGSAVITVTTANGLTASCTVTVDSAIPVDSIVLDSAAITLLETHTQTLTARLLPENATATTLLWASDDESICTVDENGLVTAVSAGTTSVTATTESGLTARCTVTVLPCVHAITLSCPGAFHPGDTASVSAELLPADAHDPTILWSVAPTELATIDTNGTVTFLAPGYITVTATAADLGIVTAVLELECLAERVYTLPAALTTIDKEAFMGSPVQCVVLHGNVTAIGANAFADCTGLYKAVIPASVTSIDPTAFSGCTLTIVAPEGSFAQQWALENGQSWRAD